MHSGIQAFKHSSIFQSKGSTEDEINDGTAQYAKLRPMRLELFLRGD